MKNIYWYLVFMLVFFLVFRFFGRVMFYAIRFWYIVLPAVLLLYFFGRQKRDKKDFRAHTGLDPDKEVKLKQEPEIKIEEDEDDKSS